MRKQPSRFLAGIPPAAAAAFWKQYKMVLLLRSKKTAALGCFSCLAEMCTVQLHLSHVRRLCVDEKSCLHYSECSSGVPSLTPSRSRNMEFRGRHIKG